jgi:hypothetical protein
MLALFSTAKEEEEERLISFPCSKQQLLLFFLLLAGKLRTFIGLQKPAEKKQMAASFWRYVS